MLSPSVVGRSDPMTRTLPAPTGMRPLTAPPSADCAEPLVPFPLPPVVEAAEGCEVLQRRLGMDRWMVARSPAMLAIGARAQQLADFEVAVLLLGEIGSGKEVLARFIHECSPQAPPLSETQL